MTGSGGAERASKLNTQLMHDYGVVGTPAIAGALDYATASLKQGMPSYVSRAYEQARMGVKEQLAHGTATAAGQAAEGFNSVGAGSALRNLSGIAATSGEAYARERSSIATSKEVAGLEQRNKLMSIMSGGGATATNLAAGFGQLTNQGLALTSQPNQAMGLGLGAIAAGLSAYGQSQSRSQPGSSLAWNPANSYSPGFSQNYSEGYT